MLHTVLRRRELGESVEVIAPGLIIPVGRHPAGYISRPRSARVHQPVNEELRDRLQSQQPP